MAKYIDASLAVEMQIYDEEHEEWSEWSVTIEDLLNRWADQGCPPTIEVSEDCISRKQAIEEMSEALIVLFYDYNMEQDELVETIEEQVRGCAQQILKSLPPVTPTVSEDAISREVAIDIIKNYDFEFPEYMERFVNELRDAMKKDLVEDITNAPSVVPAERTGEWTDRRFNGNTTHMTCSVCGEEAYQFDNFCPNCGAKMKGGTENE